MSNRKETFVSMILDDSYISWLNRFMCNKIMIDNLYYVHDNIVDEQDKNMIDYLECLFIELLAYKIKSDDYDTNIFQFGLKYEDHIYIIKYDGECYSCEICLSVCRNNLNGVKYVQYEQFKETYDYSVAISTLDDLINKVVENPSEFYSKICDALTPEERNLLIAHLQGKNCANCTTDCFSEEIRSQGYGCDNLFNGGKSDWFNSELIGRSRVLNITDLNKLNKPKKLKDL